MTPVKRIPFSRPYPLNAPRLAKGFEEIVETRWYTKGKNVKRLEEALVSYLDVDHAIATGTGSSALLIGLRSYADRIGVESITVPAFTFDSVRYTIEFAGIKDIRYGDVDPRTWTLVDQEYPTDIVMGMDTFGNKSDIKETETERLFFDAAQSFGAEISRDRGAIEIISFAGGKVITTGGEGGAIVTNDGVLAAECRHLRDLFSKMPEACAFIGVSMMDHIDDILKQKAEIAKLYRKKIPLQFQEITATNNYIVGCLMDGRDEFIAENRERVDFRDFYREPLKSPEITDMLSKRMLCLPNGPDVIPNIDFICALVNRSLEG
ncbi:DegT/DnrJ/EryC1/StrS aminotransferase family protein [Candidatus Bathyarchaeota archaeon]|nr:DegT/DnrJ/EryC1/StrS aminotransferase family protein [Candidatus Bathyarchaeota archaeon]